MELQSELMSELVQIRNTLDRILGRAREGVLRAKRESREDQGTADASRTTRERIVSLLQDLEDEALTVNEISAATGIPPGTVRVSLYHQPHLFEKEHIAANRVRWRMKVGFRRSVSAA